MLAFQYYKSSLHCFFATTKCCYSIQQPYGDEQSHIKMLERIQHNALSRMTQLPGCIRNEQRKRDLQTTIQQKVRGIQKSEEDHNENGKTKSELCRNTTNHNVGTSKQAEKENPTHITGKSPKCSIIVVVNTQDSNTLYLNSKQDFRVATKMLQQMRIFYLT